MKLLVIHFEVNLKNIKINNFIPCLNFNFNFNFNLNLNFNLVIRTCFPGAPRVGRSRSGLATFIIFNFHSDRGSEFINKLVAKLLNKLLIEQTKSRSRHCNDNALVESKNGSVIRKNMGYTHINFKAAEIISNFYEKWFNPYLNYHRPSLFVTETIKDRKGKEKKVYGEAAMPYEKLKEISKTKKKDFLKEGITFEKLDIIAYQYSDNQYARIMRMKEKQLFDKIKKMKG